MGAYSIWVFKILTWEDKKMADLGWRYWKSISVEPGKKKRSIYLIHGGEGERYHFPSEEDIRTQADAAFTDPRIRIRGISINKEVIEIAFDVGVFSINRDRVERNKFFQWIIKQLKEVT